MFIVYKQPCRTLFTKKRKDTKGLRPPTDELKHDWKVRVVITGKECGDHQGHRRHTHTPLLFYLVTIVDALRFEILSISSPLLSRKFFVSR
jgi:hypothetical protein